MTSPHVTEPDAVGIVVAEIEALHVAFERIFAGDADALERVDASLDPNFAMVPPSGEVVDRASVLAMLKGALGSVELAIRIENAHLQWTDGNTAVARYEEWQEAGGNTTARQASVAFAVDPDAPGGLRWLWVHETWMPS